MKLQQMQSGRQEPSSKHRLGLVKQHGNPSPSTRPVTPPLPPQHTAHSFRNEGTDPPRLQLTASYKHRMSQRKPPEPLRRAVADCLSASHHVYNPPFVSEALRTLQDYLTNPMTIHVAYTVLLEHALAERDRSPPVVMKCVALLKKYLFRYIPPTSTLQQIDSFCASLIAECNSATTKRASRMQSLQGEAEQSRSPMTLAMTPISPTLPNSVFASEALLKSLAFVRAIVARHLPHPSSSFIGNSSFSKSAAPILSAQRNSRMFSSHYDNRATLKGTQVDNKQSACSTLENFGVDGYSDGPGDYAAIDVLKWRWLEQKGRQIWVPSPVMLDSGGIARPQVQHLPNAEAGAAALLINGSSQNKKDWFEEGEAVRLGSSVDIADQLLTPSKVGTMTETKAGKSHLNAVSAAKRHKPQPHSRWDGDAPFNTTVRKRPRPLFHYRCYSQQQPLRLSDAEIEEVIAAVCSDGVSLGTTSLALVPAFPGNQTGKFVPETADIAASVLIKLLIDMYMSDSIAAAPLTLTILQGMLSSSIVAVRTRAFDLVLNLGVHAHLLEPTQGEDQDTVQEVPAFQGVSDEFSKDIMHGDAAFHEQRRAGSQGQGIAKNDFKHGTPPAVALFEAWMLDVLCEMLLFLVQVHERDEGVWAAALSSLFYLICNRGRVRRDCLNKVDIRVLRALLDVSRENAWAGEIHCMLVRMIANSLYAQLPASARDREGALVDRGYVLDKEKLEAIGGIETICYEYAQVNSSEAKNNLFAVIFDYILQELPNKGSPGSDDIQAVATALVLAEASDCMALAFKGGIRGIGGRLVQSIRRALDRDIANGRLNAVLLENLIASLDTLVGRYTLPSEDFADCLEATMLAAQSSNLKSIPALENVENFTSISTKGWVTLRALLHSPRVTYRYQGYSWLVKLLASEIGNSQASGTENVNGESSSSSSLIEFLEQTDLEFPDSQASAAAHLFFGLLKSKQPGVRRGFLVVLGQLLTQFQKPEHTNHQLVGEKKIIGNSSSGLDGIASFLMKLMNGALLRFIAANDTHRANILEMCHLMFSQICVRWPPLSPGNIDSRIKDSYEISSANAGTVNGQTDALDDESREQGHKRDGSVTPVDNVLSSSSFSICAADNRKLFSMEALLLREQAAASKILVSQMPTILLYWPLIQLAGATMDDVALSVAVGSKGSGNVPGGVSDVRVSLLLLLIGKCTIQSSAFEDVGGEEFFKSLLDDNDARIAYYTSSFLLKRMMVEEPEKYQRTLHNLVFKAQQSNNEKLLENPYLQMRGILQLATDSKSQDDS